MNPERRQPIEQEKVAYINQKLRSIGREIETTDEIRTVFKRLYDTDVQQVIELVKTIIWRDSRLLITPGLESIDMEDFTPQIEINIKDMLDTLLQ